MLTITPNEVGSYVVEFREAYNLVDYLGENKLVEVYHRMKQLK